MARELSGAALVRTARRRPACLPRRSAGACSEDADPQRPSGRRRPGVGRDIASAITGLLYSDLSWGFLDDALAEAALGDSGSLHEAIDNFLGRVHDPEQPEAPDANLVINCSDARPGPPKRAILAAARRLEATYPVFGRYGAGWLVGCKYWTGVRHVLPVPETSGAPPIVVVGTRHDPATPYAGAVAMAQILGSGHLLTWEGFTHTAYGQTECITEAVDAYLLDLTVPPRKGPPALPRLLTLPQRHVEGEHSVDDLADQALLHAEDGVGVEVRRPRDEHMRRHRPIPGRGHDEVQVGGPVGVAAGRREQLADRAVVRDRVVRGARPSGSGSAPRRRR